MSFLVLSFTSRRSVQSFVCLVCISLNKCSYCPFCRRRPYTFTPLHESSPYDPAKLGFLFLAVRGMFILPPEEAVQTRKFHIERRSKTVASALQSGNCSGQINVSIVQFWVEVSIILGLLTSFAILDITN